MSQRFIRCVHCGLPHDVMQLVCPATGKAIDRRRVNTSSIPAHDGGPSSQRNPGSQPPAAGSVARQPIAPIAPLPPIQPIGMGVHASTIPPGKAGRQLTGKTIGGKYLVRAVLGEGGMGTVFEAENLAIGRSVAVKVLHPNQARKKVAVKRFHQEARAAGAIGHPNICEVYDLGTLDDGSPYLVMEKLVGETLADRIASEGGLPFDDVIDVLTQVLSGLVAAHEKGIVHRDIKPENIFLTKRVGCPPVAKLLDFGVSKMISPVLSGEREEDLDLTRTGMVMGTPFYMSPEQARGDRNLDARVDLWACGVILYEALTGRRPFTAANYNALLLQILTTQPRPARELRPALPFGFDEVIDRSMARGREERFQSAAEFQRELQSLRDRHPKVTGMSMNVADVARQAFARPKPPAAPIQPIAPGQRAPQPPQPALARGPQPPPAPPRGMQAPLGVRPPMTSQPTLGSQPQIKPYVPAPPPPVVSPPIRRVDVVRRSEPPDDPPISEPTPSSVEIPVLFSETPMSGEQLPHLGTGDVEMVASSEPGAMEDLPTEINYRERDHGSDTDTTERRTDLSHLSMGKRPRVGNLRNAQPPPAPPAAPPITITGPMSGPPPDTQKQPPPAISAAPTARSVPDFKQTDTDRDARRGEFKASDTEGDDNNATLIQSSAALNALRRRPPRPPSPDDTVRMDSEMTESIHEASMSPLPAEPTIPRAPPTIPRAPKMPR